MYRVGRFEWGATAAPQARVAHMRQGLTPSPTHYTIPDVEGGGDKFTGRLRMIMDLLVGTCRG